MAFKEERECEMLSLKYGCIWMHIFVTVGWYLSNKTFQLHRTEEKQIILTNNKTYLFDRNSNVNNS
jgi:hypothetical protein